MSKKVLMEYKNVKIHSKSEDREGNVYYYCDTNRTELKKVTETKIFEFKDYHYEETPYSIKIKKDKNAEANVIQKKYFRSNYDVTHVELSKLFFNRIDLSKNEIIFENYKEGKDNNIYEFGVSFELIELNAKNSDEKLASGKVKIKLSYYICPECGKELPINFYYESKTKLLGMYVFNDDNNIKLTLMYKQVATHEKLAWVRYYKNMVVYKKKTGKIYKVDNFNFAASKYMKQKYPKIVKEVTFCCAPLLRGQCCRDDDLTKGYQAINNLIIEDLKERTGQDFEYAKSDVKNYRRAEEFSYIYLLQMKRKYNINNIYLAELLLRARQGYGAQGRNLHKYVKNMNEKEMMQFFKVNKKKLKRIDESNHYGTVVTFFDLLDDVNSMNELLEAKRAINVNREEVKYKDFLYQYRKHNTERKFINQLKKVNDHYTITDTVRLFVLIKEKMKDYAVDYSKSIEELHDIFSNDYNKMKHENQKIPQDKAINKIFKDLSYGEITYRAAKDTNELIKIGAFMDICVGGYGKDAVAKKCIIVAGYNSEDKPVTCIELRKHGGKYSLHQVKKRKNKTPKQSECDALNKLFIEHEVTIRTSDIDDNRHNALSESEGEILIAQNPTYSRNIPEELRLEILNEMNVNAEAV